MTLHSSSLFAAGQPQQLQEGSSGSSSSGGRWQRLETGAEGDSASVNSHSHGRVSGVTPLQFLCLAPGGRKNIFERRHV